MSKVQIRLISLGQLPAEFDKSVIEKRKSEVFLLTGTLDNYALTCDSDGEDWDFSDNILSDQIIQNFKGDLLIAITNVPLQDNYFTRRLSGNRIAFTFHEIKDYFLFENIPLENVVLRLIYAYSLVFRRSNDRIPQIHELTNFTHDETRGCLFDMNGIKRDVIHSCINPIICEDCKERLKKEKVSNNMIAKIEKEIKSIRKNLFFRISDYVKSHPIRSLIISGVAAIILGTLSSMLGTYLYELLK